MDIELTLAVPARTLVRLRRHPLLRVSGSTRMVSNEYYDTPELDLWRHGMAFRVRHYGVKWGRTLKGTGSAQARLRQRVELETQFARMQPDFAALAAASTGGTLLPPITLPRLRSVFITKFKRTQKTIHYKQLITIVVSIDIGFIKSAARTAPICELKLVSPSSGALFEVALALLEDVPLVIESRSKAERGYTLFRSSSPQPQKVGAVELAPEISAMAAFKSIVGTLLAQAQGNRTGVMEGRDPEYLHQMRVAVRRLRSVCGTYANLLPQGALRPLIADLKWLFRSLGPARNTDVFVTEIWPSLRSVLRANPLLEELDTYWFTRQHAAAAKARRALTARRYQRLMLCFGRLLAAEDCGTEASLEQLALLNGLARVFARGVLERRDAKVRSHGHAITKMDNTQLHSLRIEIKKLRYAADNFGSLFEDADVRKMVNNLSRLQDILGALNDTHVAGQQVAAALAYRRGRVVSEVHAALAEWRDARVEKFRRKLHAAWRRFRRAEHFW